ncbi:PREDICTED: ribonuclease 3-like protein 2 isoform X1 [Ipomoea nil]|uniref:ribonuclease 3-like protein 2 isoform X1 n=2 Tax=Ipomoea nil TaxID=35883 RepID=UPI000901D8BC|nr:PREDICTED: ribonuclease 3-like protein 2 isoform X1 [Ipomoea nil]
MNPFRLTCAYALPELESEEEEMASMDASVAAVEQLLQYQFKNRKLLEEALTHSSYTESASYQRLEFLGDMALGLAITNFVFLAYPELDPGQLSLLRAANISTEKLARVAVRHSLYKYVRHNATGLDERVKEFVLVVQEEQETEFYGGAMKAPKVLADIVESIAAAVYVDCDFDLKELWVIFRGLLDPIITLEMLQHQPQPVTMLYELCQKVGKVVDIKHWRNGDKNIASVYIDGEFLVSSSSEQKENARLHAAKAALEKMAYKVSNKYSIEFDATKGNDGAKQKLYELCGKRKWPKPTYRVEKELGPSHDRKFVCSVQVDSGDDGVVFRVGKERSRVMYAAGDEMLRIKDAENSAAFAMLCGLKDANVI